jgi:hypothetical protein
MVNEKEQVYIDKIDQLEKSLNTASKQYFAIDTVRLYKVYDLINMNLSSLTEMDTLFFDSIKNYAFMQKTFKKFFHEHQLIIDEFQYSSNQLQTLKNDIRRGKRTEGEIEKYYFEEVEAVGALIYKMKYNAQNMEHQLQSYEVFKENVGRTIQQPDNR